MSVSCGVPFINTVVGSGGMFVTIPASLNNLMFCLNRLVLLPTRLLFVSVITLTLTWALTVATHNRSPNVVIKFLIINSTSPASQASRGGFSTHCLVCHSPVVVLYHWNPLPDLNRTLMPFPAVNSVMADSMSVSVLLVAATKIWSPTVIALALVPS